MANCSQCGSWIPDEQQVCSMCYGDMDYGRDGYYRAWAEEKWREEEEERAAFEEYCREESEE